MARWFGLLLFLLAPVLWAKAPVVTLTMDAPVGPAIADYLERGLAHAEDEGAQLVVLSLNTPGGLDASMRDMVSMISDASLPVAVYVHPSGARAASAGTFLLYAAHIAAMTPGSNIGAATPVQLSTEAQSDAKESAPESPATDANREAMRRKATNDAAALIRSLAELRGRNADWGERAVREAASLSAEQALEENVIDLLADDLEQLLNKIDGREITVQGRTVVLDLADVPVIDWSPDWRTELLTVLTNPNVAYILMMIGIYGLLLEFYNPGALVPGVLGAICLVLGLFALQTLPISYAGLALIGLGVAFMVAEAFVPSFGMLGLGGVASFVIGSIILLDTDSPAFELSVALVGGVAAASALMIFGLAYMMTRIRGKPLVSGDNALIGRTGEALADITDEGQVRVGGEIWRATTATPLTKGQRVKIEERDGLLLRVAPISQTTQRNEDQA